MRRAFPLTAAAAILCGMFWLKYSNVKQVPSDLDTQTQASFASELYSGDGMENSTARKEWERKRLADPATGEIPSGIRAKELAFAATLPTAASYKADSLNVPWTHRGPWNIGGRTRAFAMDVTNDSILLAGGVSGGIWRSTDQGGSWTRITTPQTNPGVCDLIQDKRPGKTNNWYALSGEGYGTSASGGGAFYLGTGLFKSTDDGLTWSLLSSTNSGTPQSFDNVWDIGWRVALNETDTVNDRVTAALIGAIMHSKDGGATWTRTLGSTTLNLSYFTDVMTTPIGISYATLSSEGTDAGIWRSTDDSTWTNIDPPFLPAVYGRIVMCTNPLDENRLYFLAAQTDSTGKLTTNFRGDPEWNSLWRYTYISGDGSGSGGSWEDLTINIPASDTGAFDDFIAQGGYDLVVSVNPWDTNTVIIGGTNLYRSTSAFNDSTNSTHIAGYGVGAGSPELYFASYPNQHPDQHVLFWHPTDSNVLFNANDGGLYRTDDVTAGNVSWTPLNNGYIVSQFYTVGLDHGSLSDVVIGGLQDNGTYWTDNETITSPWNWIGGGDGAYLAITDGGQYYYLSKQLGRIAKCSVDASGTVTAYERIDPIGASDYRFINPFVLDPNDQNVMYLPEGPRIWRNSDLSAISLNDGWDSISTNWTMLPDTIPGDANITSIGVSTSPANRIYVGTDDKHIYRIDNADSTQPTMTYITTSQMPSGGNVSCMAVHPDDGDQVMAVFSNYSVYSLWYSTNGGTQWMKVAGNLEQNISGSGNGPSVRWVTIIPDPDGDIFLAATSTGLYATDSLNGTSTVWVQMGANSIGNMIVDMIDYRRSDGKTVIATHGYGIWSANIGGQGVSIDPVLNEERLITLFPNPSSAKTTLSIENPMSEKMQILVYDIEGKLVEKQSHIHSAGRREVELNSNGLRPGVYFVKVIGEGWSEVRKFIRQ